MNKNIGLFSTSLLTIGAMVGSAIFSLSGITIAISGSGSLFTWLIAGILLLIYGLLAAYLAYKYPKTGGMFLFPVEVFFAKSESSEREIPRKILGSFTTIIYLGGCLSGVIFSLQYISIYFSYLFPVFQDYGLVISLLFGLLVFLLNILNINNTSKVNIVFTICLIIILLVYSLQCLFSGKFDLELINNNFDSLSNVTSGVPIAMLAYGSIVVPAFLAESIKNSKKTIPFSQIISMIITISIYLLAIFATLGIVNKQNFIDNPGSQYMPFNLALNSIGSTSFINIINFGAILALFTTALVVMRLSIVSFNEFSKNNIFPPKINLAFNNEKISAIFVFLIISVSLSFGAIAEQVVNIGGIFNFIFIAIICLTSIICFIKTKVAKQN